MFCMQDIDQFSGTAQRSFVFLRTSSPDRGLFYCLMQDFEGMSQEKAGRV